MAVFSTGGRGIFAPASASRGRVSMNTVNHVLGVVFIAIGGLNMIIGGKNKEKWPKK